MYCHQTNVKCLLKFRQLISKLLKKLSKIAQLVNKEFLIMWRPPTVDPVNEKDAIFHDLLEECRRAAPGARLSYSLRSRLEKFTPDVRSEIVNRVKVGCSPLFVACKKGQVEIAEYLLVACNADIEQRGLYEVPEDRSTHVVTPLWCAAVSGNLRIVKLLLDHGADVNALSDTGSTPVRSACFMSHFDIVKYLLLYGADINKPNYNGGTCLINSVQSVALCEFLISKGADVNARDIQNKTALHYAIQEHRLETTKLLIESGADYNAQSRYGDDALQMACLKGAVHIFQYLSSTIEYSPEKLANAHELLGATFVYDQNDVIIALQHWREGLAIRLRHGLVPKQPVMPLREAYRYQAEFQTTEELDNVSTNLDFIRIQSLIITERILGPSHKDTIIRLMYRGASYIDMMRIQRCIDIWRRALEIRVQRDTILYTDTCFTAQALVRIMIDFNEGVQPENEQLYNQRFHDVYSTFKLLVSGLIETRDLLTIRPVYNRQADFYDKILKCVTHLIYLLLETAHTTEQKQEIERSVSELIKINLRSITSEDTLLHLCVSKLNTIRSNYFLNENPIVIFPTCSVIKFLLDHGAPVNARNESKSTPLHIATLAYNYTRKVVKLLLDYGAHIDQPNSSGTCPSNAIMNSSKHMDPDFHVLNYISLKCLCATVIAQYAIPYRNQIPKTLEPFVQMHEG